MSVLVKRTPTSDVVLAEFRRQASTLQLRHTKWSDGKTGVSVCFSADRAGPPVFTFVVVYPHEIRAVAGRLLDLADAEGWK